ncbi:hypothetical protein CJJ18_03930 [Candidatus Williamhamiltonella defendens]|uniref:Uncharacterized protein n=2 Tax=Candidatus Williamhamiltonella defendens TaxID=138072 RepID=A0AAC9YF69_9ENTR|nr:hypothetical protein CJJ18_03930 [Candidatus Hamiltonella defensa]AWK16299.1 hypothetical protein CCS40_03825 [Candidatus Hamiltonella defensa]
MTDLSMKVFKLTIPASIFLFYQSAPKVGVVQKQYRLTIAQGDHLRGALSSAHYHLSSDIRIDLSN